MKLKHLAAFLLLAFAVGCAQPTSPPPAADTGNTDSGAAETGTELALNTVNFDVAGMH